MTLRIPSLQTRLAVWFTAGTLLCIAVFSLATFLHLREELRNKQVKAYYPDHPDWKLHGSVQDTGEIADIMTELVETSALFVGPLLILTVFLGMRLARISLQPVAEINQQLQNLGSNNLSSPIVTRATDRELASLVCHLNELLSRLDRSFVELRDYVAHVTHEIRTPLTVMRLKLERAEGRFDEEMSEEFQSELHRLSIMTEQALQIARAEHGRIIWNVESFSLEPLIAECVDDFRILAENDGRQIIVSRLDQSEVTSDRYFLKQILYSLLANALKHGEGNIHLRVKATRNHLRLLIVNHVRQGPDGGRQQLALGLGIRLAQALLRLQSSIHLRRRSNPRFYVAQLRIVRPVQE